MTTVRKYLLMYLNLLIIIYKSIKKKITSTKLRKVMSNEGPALDNRTLDNRVLDNRALDNRALTLPPKL